MDPFIKKQLFKSGFIFLIFLVLSVVFGSWHGAFATDDEISISISSYDYPDIGIGQIIDFSIATNDPLGKTCTVLGAGGGSVVQGPSPSVCTYTAPLTPGTYTMRATSVTSTSTYAEVSITVSPIYVDYSFQSQPFVVATNRMTNVMPHSNDNTGFTWSVQEANGGSVIDGVYTAPTTAGTYHITATSKTDPTKSDTTTVNVVAVNISISPTTLTLPATNQTTFSVTTNDPTYIDWQIVEGSIGYGYLYKTGLTTEPSDLRDSVQSGGASRQFVAPSTPGTYHVRVTSALDDTKYAVATLTVQATLVVVSPSILTVYSEELKKRNGSTNFAVSTADPEGVVWSSPDFDIEYDFTRGGPVFTAPINPGMYYIKATNSADATQSGGAIVKVIASPISITVSPTSAVTTIAKNTVQFQANVTGTSDKNVIWEVAQPRCSTRAAVSCRPVGTIDQNGLYTASNGIGTDYVCAFSVITPSMYGSDIPDASSRPNCVPVSVSEGIDYTNRPGLFGSGDNASISISPASTTIRVGSTAKFTVSSSIPNYVPIVTWSIKESKSKEDTSAGKMFQKNPVAALEYTAPMVPGTYHLIALSTFGTSTATINVINSNEPLPISISISPPSITLRFQTPTSTPLTQQFTATVSNATNTAVTWGVSPGGGSITSSGMSSALYTAPKPKNATATSTIAFVTATSVADPTKIATSMVTVTWPLPKENPIPVVAPIEVISGTRPATTTASTTATTTATGTIVSAQATSSTPFVTQVAEQATVVVQSFAKAAEATVTAIQTPTGSAVVNSVSTVGAVTGASTWAITSLLASPLFSSPIAASEMFFIPLRLWGLALSALGLKRRNRPWGTIYDSITKMPIDPAVVTLYDQANKKVSTSITDLDGRFGFIVPKGTYHLKVEKTNYTFPSAKLTGKSNDEIYSNLYFGEKIEVAEDGSVIYRNIPMDPKNFDWNEFTKNKMGVMQFHSLSERFNNKFSDIIFWTGFAVGFISVFIIPRAYSITILTVYVILIVLRFSGVTGRVFGTITDSANRPLSFATISVFSKDLHRELFKKITDRYGRYYVLVPKGDYEIKVSRKNDDESYTEVYQKEINAKDGVINGAIKV